MLQEDIIKQKKLKEWLEKRKFYKEKVPKYKLYRNKKFEKDKHEKMTIYNKNFGK